MSSKTDVTQEWGLSPVGSLNAVFWLRILNLGHLCWRGLLCSWFCLKAYMYLP